MLAPGGLKADGFESIGGRSVKGRAGRDAPPMGLARLDSSAESRRGASSRGGWKSKEAARLLEG